MPDAHNLLPQSHAEHQKHKAAQRKKRRLGDVPKAHSQAAEQSLTGFAAPDQANRQPAGQEEEASQKLIRPYSRNLVDANLRCAEEARTADQQNLSPVPALAFPGSSRNQAANQVPEAEPGRHK